MKCTKLVPRHTLDNGQLMPFEMFLTEDHRLMILGCCQVCGNSVAVGMKFAELYDQFPSTEAEDIEAERLLAHALGVEYVVDSQALSPQTNTTS